MKILIITASNPYKTAGVVSLDLLKGLSSITGNEVRVLVRVWDKYSDKKIIPYENRITHYKNWSYRKAINVFRRLGILTSGHNKTNKDYSVQDYDQTITKYDTKKILKKIDFDPDVILIQFMQNFLSYKNIMELYEITRAPIFIYMMDMAPMTGGCHYAWNCNGYVHSCGNCPAIYSKQEKDQSSINWAFKHSYIEKTDITAIAGSEWQYQQLLKSSLFNNKQKIKILLGIDGEKFKPGEKKHARSLLKLPFDKRIIFLGALSLDANRKGYKELLEALKILKQQTNDSLNIHLVLAGYAYNNLIENLPFENTLLGFLSHDQLALTFQAADLFLCPSIEDSGPMMINQSVMCGTPVVAFEMGVALDLVDSGKTGYRAKLKDCEDLAKGIKNVLELDYRELQSMQLNCANIGYRLCNSKEKGKELTALFKTKTKTPLC